MAADPFSSRAQETDEPSRLRALGIAAFLMLATAFLYQAMDGVQQANEQAERRQRIAQSACRSCTVGDDDSQYDDEAAAIAAEAAARADAAAAAAADAAAHTIHTAPVVAPTPAATTAPAEPIVPAPVVPVLEPTGKP